jgi:hypothetical protein
MLNEIKDPTVADFLVIGKASIDHLMADVAQAAPNGLRDRVLGLSGLLRIGDHFTVFKTRWAMFIAHHQHIVKPDWMSFRPLTH